MTNRTEETVASHEEPRASHEAAQVHAFFHSHEEQHGAIYDEAAGAYDTWAVANFRAPQIIARKLSELGVSRDARILDFGAGTGLAGQALRDLGFNNVTAFDVSGAMLALARERGVYVRVIHAAELPEASPAELYDVVISSGVFTGATSAGETELRALQGHLRAGGMLVLNNRVNNDRGRCVHAAIHKMFADQEFSSLLATWEDNVVELTEHRLQIFFVLRRS